MTTSDTMTTRDETVTAIAKGIANGTPYRVMDLAADLDLTTAEDHAARLERMRRRYEDDMETADDRMDAARDRRDEEREGC